MAIEYVRNKPFSWMEVGEKFRGVERGDKTKYTLTQSLLLDLGQNYSKTLYYILQDHGDTLMNVIKEFITLNGNISCEFDFTEFPFIVTSMAGSEPKVKYNGYSNSRFLAIGILDAVPQRILSNYCVAVDNSLGVVISTFGITTGSNTPVIRRTAIGGIYDSFQTYTGGERSYYKPTLGLQLTQVRTGNFINNSQMSAMAVRIDGLGNVSPGGRADGNRR